MISFDPSIVRTTADRLNEQAKVTVFLHVLGGGLALGFSSWYVANPAIATLCGASGLVLGAIVGAVVGQGKALVLRGQAQSLLCQVEIEQNTRAKTIAAAA